jgi:sugar (pentulose or hexulose) kinase
VLTNPSEGEVFAPVALFLDAIDLVLQRLKEQGADFSKVQGISGAGMQHGTVFWSKDAESILGSLDPGKTLLEQLEGGAKGERKSAFSHPFSPNWQDASTQKQCEEFDKKLGTPEELAEATGSKAHHVCACATSTMREAILTLLAALQRTADSSLPSEVPPSIHGDSSYLARIVFPRIRLPRQGGPH